MLDPIHGHVAAYAEGPFLAQRYSCCFIGVTACVRGKSDPTLMMSHLADLHGHGMRRVLQLCLCAVFCALALAETRPSIATDGTRLTLRAEQVLIELEDGTVIDPKQLMARHYNYKSKWRNIWDSRRALLSDPSTFSAGGSQPKHVSNPA